MSETNGKGRAFLREIRKIVCVILAAAMYGFSIRNFLRGAGLLAEVLPVYLCCRSRCC